MGSRTVSPSPVRVMEKPFWASPVTRTLPPASVKPEGASAPSIFSATAVRTARAEASRDTVTVSRSGASSRAQARADTASSSTVPARPLASRVREKLPVSPATTGSDASPLSNSRVSRVSPSASRACPPTVRAGTSPASSR